MRDVTKVSKLSTESGEKKQDGSLRAVNEAPGAGRLTEQVGHTESRV